jgi:gluconolactonase
MNYPIKLLALLLLSSIFLSCNNQNHDAEVNESVYLEDISFVINDPSFFNYISEDVEIEILSTGHGWTEGPVWVESEKILLFSDIPNNAIYSWKQGEKASLYLAGAGGDYNSDEGSNGLLILDNRLFLCQHGARQLAFMDGRVNDPINEFTTIVSTYKGNRLNSPNDAVIAINGDLYFTDPPYGLSKQDQDTLKELPYNGVFKYSTDKNLVLLTDKLTRPNGIAITNDQKRLIVSNSDRKLAQWHSYDIKGDSLVNHSIFYDATDSVGQNSPGLPDGLKMHSSGTLFATGPGGLYIFSKELALLGILKLDRSSSNLAFDSDEKNLFITASDLVLRLPIKSIQ